jgi:hypothetical protein
VRLDGADVVIDRSQLRLQPLPADRFVVLKAVMEMKTPADVKRVLERYGVGALGVGPLRGELRQPIAQYLNAAADLRFTLELHVRIRQAQAGDRTVLALLRREYERVAADVWRDEDLTQDERFLCCLTDLVAWAIQTGIRTTWLYFQGGHAEPNVYRFLALSDTLLEASYGELARLFAERLPISVCAYEVCGRPFMPTRPNQLYCTPACASNKRYRAWRAGHPKGRS